MIIVIIIVIVFILFVDVLTSSRKAIILNNKMCENKDFYTKKALDKEKNLEAW